MGKSARQARQARGPPPAAERRGNELASAVDEDLAAVEASLHRLAKCQPRLLLLRDGSPQIKKQLMKDADKDFILSLCELSANILNGNIELTPQSRESLRRYRVRLRQLARAILTTSRRTPRSSARASRRSTTQRGGGEGGGGGRALRVRSAGGFEWQRHKRDLVLQRGSGPFLTALVSSALGGIVGKIVSNLVPAPKRGL